jgi:hypothetical protein
MSSFLPKYRFTLTPPHTKATKTPPLPSSTQEGRRGGD